MVVSLYVAMRYVDMDSKSFRYHFCEKCYGEIEGDTVRIGDDPTMTQRYRLYLSVLNSDLMYSRM